MPPIIKVADAESEAAAVSAANNVRDTTGSTLYFAGNSSAAYDMTGLTIPRNTNILGDGRLSVLSGNPTIESTTGEPIYQQVVFSNGCTVSGIRRAKFLNCRFLGTMAWTGPCYYNTVDTCNWYVLGSTPCLTTVDNTQNANHVINGHAYYEGMGFDLSCPDTEAGYSNGWSFIGTSLEGNPDAASDAVLGPAIKLAGRAHWIEGLWLEHGLARTYSPNHAITLLATTENCKVGTCEWGHLTTIQNLGTNNEMPPYLVAVGGRIVTS